MKRVWLSEVREETKFLNEAYNSYDEEKILISTKKFLNQMRFIV